MDKEQIKAISESIPMEQRFSVEQIVSAAIESYKAELLKEVGEPVLYAEFAEDGGWLGDASEYADHLEEPHALYTSDQLAAAILKATKPLEERRCEICGYAEHHRKHTSCLRTQLAAAQEEIQKLRLDLLTSYGESEDLSGQLAKAEQRVAEAISAMCNKSIAPWEQRRHGRTEAEDKVIEIIEGIEAGEWRKFVKEV